MSCVSNPDCTGKPGFLLLTFMKLLLHRFTACRWRMRQWKVYTLNWKTKSSQLRTGKNRFLTQACLELQSQLSVKVYLTLLGWVVYKKSLCLKGSSSGSKQISYLVWLRLLISDIQVIKGSKIKFKGWKLVLWCVFFASTNVNWVVKYVSILTLSSQSDCIFRVNRFVENVYQLSCEEFVNIHLYFTIRL